MKDTTDAIVTAGANKATFVGGALAAFGGLTATDIAAFGGLVLAFVGFALNAWLRLRQEKREIELHKARMTLTWDGIERRKAARKDNDARA